MWNVTFLVTIFSEARVQVWILDGFWGVMADNARNHARMCFLRSEYLILAYDPYLPQNLNFWPKICNFKLKYWKIKVQVYQKVLNRLTWKFNTMLEFSNVKWWCHDIFSTADGRHFENCFIATYISAADHPVLIKYAEQMHISIQRMATWWKIKILQIQNGVRTPSR